MPTVTQLIVIFNTQIKIILIRIQDVSKNFASLHVKALTIDKAFGRNFFAILHIPLDAAHSYGLQLFLLPCYCYQGGWVFIMVLDTSDNL